MEMQNIRNKAKGLITVIDTPAGDVFEMSVFEMARWMALMKAMEHIDHQARRLKQNLDDNDDWIQPIAISKFVNEISDDILLKVLQDEEFLATTKRAPNDVPAVQTIVG